jgi:hypothetical protein
MAKIVTPRLGQVLLLVIAIPSLANALWMLAAPSHWYLNVPAGVPDFGPLNHHFVRDLGCAFLCVAVALIAAARSSAPPLPLVLVAGTFFWAHAAIHIFDTATGHVGAHHWALDLPLTYLPAVLLAVLVITRMRADRPLSL